MSPRTTEGEAVCCALLPSAKKGKAVWGRRRSMMKVLTPPSGCVDPQSYQMPLCLLVGLRSSSRRRNAKCLRPRPLSAQQPPARPPRSGRKPLPALLLLFQLIATDSNRRNGRATTSSSSSTCLFIYPLQSVPRLDSSMFETRCPLARPRLFGGEDRSRSSLSILKLLGVFFRLNRTAVLRI